MKEIIHSLKDSSLQGFLTGLEMHVSIELYEYLIKYLIPINKLFNSFEKLKQVMHTKASIHPNDCL